MLYFATEEYAKGRDALREGLQRVPLFIVGNLMLAAYYVMLGDDAHATEQIQFVHRRAPTRASVGVKYGALYFWRDLRVQARMRDAVIRAYALIGFTP